MATILTIFVYTWTFYEFIIVYLSHKSKKAENLSIPAIQGSIIDGAEGEIQVFRK